MTAKWKSRVFLAILVIILIRIIYICAYGEIDKEYFTSAQIDTTYAIEVPCKDLTQKFSGNANRLNSVELILDGIADDKTGTITLKILSENNLIYQTDLSLTNITNGEWKKVFINAALNLEKEYEIYITSSEDCTQTPMILMTEKKNSSPEAIASYSGDNLLGGEIAVRYGYLKFPGWVDRIVAASIWILALVAVYNILYYFESIEGVLKKGFDYLCMRIGKETFYIVSELLESLVIIECSGIAFQGPTKILMYLISICSSIKINEKRKKVAELCNTPFKKSILYFLYIYSAFALVGQRILIYPLNKSVSIADFFVLVITIIWFIPIIQTSLCLFEDFKEIFFAATKRTLKTGTFAGIIIAIILIPAAYNLFANNPGITTRDTYACMLENAHHIPGMRDWHPAFYCMVLRVILGIWDSTYTVILVQYFFWSYVVLELLLYLRKKGMKDSALIAVALFMGLNAANFMHINTIWKDIPYALSLVWTLIIGAKLSIDFEEYRNKWYIYVELFIALVGVCLYRKNGVVSFIIISLSMLVFFYKNVKIWCTLAFTILSILFIKGPIYKNFDIQDSGRYGMYIGLSQDILGVYFAGGEVSEKTLQMINVMTNYNNAEVTYTPTWAYQSYDLDVEPKEFIWNYIDTFLKNPITVIRAIIAREDALWNIFAGKDARLNEVNDNITMDGFGVWNEYYPARKYNSLYAKMLAATTYTAESQWVSAVEWRAGLFTLLGLIAMAFVVFKGGARKYMVIISPIMGHSLSLLLSTGWSDFRYFWPLNLMNMAVMLLALITTLPYSITS